MRNARFRLVCTAIASASLAACASRGPLLARAELRGPGTAEARFLSTATPPELWVSLDGMWSGGRYSKLPIHFEIDVMHAGQSPGHIACDTGTASYSVCGASRTVGSTHSGDCEVRLECQLPALPPDADVTLRVTGSRAGPIETIVDMSLLVRSKI